MSGTTSRASAHDRGRVLAQLAMTIAAGGRCLSDLRTLRDQPDLFGAVASDPTRWQAIHQIDDTRFDQLVEVRQDATRRLLEQADPVGLDLKVDATLLHLHAEQKEQAVATFEGTFGPSVETNQGSPGLAATSLRQPGIRVSESDGGREAWKALN